VFAIGSAISSVMVLVFTHLGVTPIAYVTLINVILMTGIASRMISASALTTSVPDPRDRGAFMAVNSSVQQVSGGVAAAVAGLIVRESATGSLIHYDTLGYCVVGAMVLALGQLYTINRDLGRRTAAAPARPQASQQAS
jgi:predicted MFS family arabinose efflux permease